MSIVYEGGAPRKVRFSWMSEAWGLFSAQAIVWIVSTLIAGLIFLVIAEVLDRLLVPTVNFSGFGSEGYSNPYDSIFAVYTRPGFWVTWVINQVIMAFFASGMTQMANNQVKGLPISIGDLFNGGPIFVRMLIYNVVASIVSGIAFGLCVFPGFFVTALIWPGYALVADGADAGTAYARGSEPMKRDLFMGALFALVFILILIVSALPCGLGLLVTVPMGTLISSLMYRDMVGGLTPANAGGVYIGSPVGPNAWPPAPATAPEPAPSPTESLPPAESPEPTPPPPPSQAPPDSPPPGSDAG